MKRIANVLWIIVTLVFITCEGNLNQPDLVNDSSIDGIAQHALAKGEVYLLELDANIPSGTYYGDDSHEYLATGGEQLPAGYWVENRNSQSYIIHLYSNTKVDLEEISTVVLDNPSNIEYLNSSNAWITVLSSGTVYAKAIRTGSSGSGTVTLSVGLEDMDEDGGANG